MGGADAGSVVMRPESEGSDRSRDELVASVMKRGYRRDSDTGSSEEDTLCCFCFFGQKEQAKKVKDNLNSESLDSEQVDSTLEKGFYQLGPKDEEADFLTFETDTACCWKTRKRKRVTIAVSICFIAISLFVFFMIPRQIGIDNGAELRELSSREDVDGGFRISGRGLPAMLRNNNFFNIKIRAVELRTYLPGFTASQFEIKTVASDNSDFVEIAARSSAEYKIDLDGFISIGAGLSLAAACLGNAQATYLSDTRGSVVVESPLVNGLYSLDQDDLDSSCDLVVGVF